jgi:hypothetical protein
MGDGFLLLPSEGGSTLACTSLVKGLACDSHSDDESLLLSLHGSCGGLIYDRGVILLPLSSSDDDLWLIDGEVGSAAQHGQQDTGGLVWWWTTVNPRVMSEMSGSEEKSMALITMLEKGVPLKVR